MRPTISLRPVGPADEPFLLRLYVTTRADINTSPLGRQEQADLIRMQFIAQRTSYDTSYPDGEHSIVLAANVPAGRLYVNRGADEHRVVDVSLLPEYRSAGIGTRLLEVILDGARRAGAPVRLQVDHFNPARRLYDRLGFVVVSETESHCCAEWSPPRGVILPGPDHRYPGVESGS